MSFFIFHFLAHQHQNDDDRNNDFRRARSLTEFEYNQEKYSPRTTRKVEFLTPEHHNLNNNNSLNDSNYHQVCILIMN
jgi:hypothetical protein